MYYLIPIVIITRPYGDSRTAKYLGDGTISAQWTMMDYGFVDTGLLYSTSVLPADQLFLEAQADVYVFPADLDTPVVKADVEDLFEAVNLPTDWLTPATTNRELMRQTAGMMQFNQRYGGISGGHSIFENADLSTRLRQLTAEEEEWFYLTAESFDISRDLINRNSQLRLLVRQAGDIWIGQTFYLGDSEF